MPILIDVRYFFIYRYVEGLDKNVIIPNTLGKSTERHLFLCRPKKLLTIFKDLLENNNNALKHKYTLIAPQGSVSKLNMHNICMDN